MNIFLKLKELFKNFGIKPESKQPTMPSIQLVTSAPAPSGTEIPKSSTVTETKVADILNEIAQLKDEVSIKLVTIEKEIRNIGELKEDAEKAVRKSEKTENLVLFGFFVLLVMVAGLVIAYTQFVYSGSKNDDYRYELSQRIDGQQYELLQKISNQQNDIKILKLCLVSNKWLNPKCFEN